MALNGGVPKALDRSGVREQSEHEKAGRTWPGPRAVKAD
jgi:hypothetical protein